MAALPNIPQFHHDTPRPGAAEKRDPPVFAASPKTQATIEVIPTSM
jgi:hypothetical protein